MIADGIEVIYVLVVFGNGRLSGRRLLEGGPAKADRRRRHLRELLRLDAVVGQMRRHVEAVKRKIHQHRQLRRRALFGLLSEPLQVYHQYGG